MNFHHSLTYNDRLFVLVDRVPGGLLVHTGVRGDHRLVGPVHLDQQGPTMRRYAVRKVLEPTCYLLGIRGNYIGSQAVAIVLNQLTVLMQRGLADVHVDSVCTQDGEHGVTGTPRQAAIDGCGDPECPGCGGGALAGVGFDVDYHGSTPQLGQHAPWCSLAYAFGLDACCAVGWQHLLAGKDCGGCGMTHEQASDDYADDLYAMAGDWSNMELPPRAVVPTALLGGLLDVVA